MLRSKAVPVYRNPGPLVVPTQSPSRMEEHWAITTSGTRTKTLRSKANRFEGRQGVDWRAWLALAWAIWFGAQYVEMMTAARAEKAVEILRSAMGQLHD